MNVQTDKTSMATSTATSVDIRRILQMIPHRYPMLMVDKVTEMVLAESAVGIKNVSINEPFFQGHFPGHPIMPGVLIIEAMAQAAGLLTQLSNPPRPADEEKPLYYLVKVDKARFSRIVVPGDQLSLEVEQKRMLRRMGQYVCRAVVDGEEVAGAEILCAERGP